MPEPRVNLTIKGGQVYSIAADVTIDVYEFWIDDDDSPEFKGVTRYRSGGGRDSEEITERRLLVDAGDVSRGQLA